MNDCTDGWMNGWMDGSMTDMTHVMTDVGWRCVAYETSVHTRLKNPSLELVSRAALLVFS